MKKLINRSTDPAFNLAFEEYFTARAAALDDSLLFFWRNSPAVIVGRFQNTFGEVNAALAEELGISVIRRNSGGGAVYHDLNNLNYSFIIPSGSGDYLKDAKSSGPFELLFDMILSLLSGLGVKAEKTGRNDLTLDGRKISGAARQNTKNGLLLHGTLLFDADLETLSRVLAVDPSKYESKGLKSVKSRVGNLKEALPQMDIAGFQAVLENALEAEEHLPSPADLAAIEELAASKYRNWEWNWGASPPSSLKKARRFPWGNVEIRLDLQRGVIQKAALYGDFFSEAQESESLDELARKMTGKRRQGAELRALLESLPLERIFLGADKNELVAFFLE